MRPDRARGPQLASRAIVALAVVLGLICVWRGAVELGHRPDLVPLLLGFAAVIALGEAFRFRVEDSRELAPMSLAASLALVLLASSQELGLANLPVGPPLAVVAIAMTLGSLPNVLRGRRVRVDDMAARFLGVFVTAIIYRRLPLWQGSTLLDLDAAWIGSRWPIAVLMSVTSGVGLLIYLACSAVSTASRLHRAVGQAFADEMRAGTGLGLALSATGTLVALAARPLGGWALPLFLIPLVLTQFALRQYAAVRDTFAQTVRLLSRITELGGYTRAGHPDRVAALCVEIGHDLGLSDRETRNLEYAALLHDLGQVALRDPIPAGATVMAAPADQHRIAGDSADIVRKAGVPAEVSEVIERQATPYRVVREFGEELPLLSRIVKVANAYDDFVGGSITPRRREAAIERINLGLGYEYDPRVVDSLLRVLARRAAQTA